MDASAFGSALAVEGIPSAASIDDLSGLLFQFEANHRILLSSGGAGALATALVLLPSPELVDTVAELLDGHPLAGGLLECAPCADPCLWVGRHMLQFLPTGSAASQQAAPTRAPRPAGPPAAAAAPPRPAAQQAAATAPQPPRLTLAEEAALVQQQLQQQASEGPLWDGDDDEPAAGSSSTGGDGWEQVAPAPRKAPPPKPVSGRSGYGGGALQASRQPTTKIFVGQVAPGVKVPQLKAAFSKYGQPYDLHLEKSSNGPDQWAMLRFTRVEEAQAAYEALQGKLIPGFSLGRLKLQYRPA